MSWRKADASIVAGKYSFGSAASPEVSIVPGTD